MPRDMIRARFLSFLLRALLLAFSSALSNETQASATSPNTRSAVVGVLSQPHYIPTQWDPAYYYVAASYVKWLELAGARAIPIPYDAEDDLVDEIFSQVDGILFPGGGSDLPDSARRVWDLFLRENSEGTYFPMWATCLGYEYVVMMVASQGPEIIEKGFDSENVSLPLNLLNVAESKLYADPTIQTIVSTKNVTFDNHGRGLEPRSFMNDTALQNMFFMISTSNDRQGRPFVSTIEPKSPDLHPVYGVQYHPEKNPFEYGVFNGTNMPYEAIDHSPEGIYMSFHLANFFGTLLQKSVAQRGSDRYTEFVRHPLVYSYPSIRTEEFEQKYIIPPAAMWNALSTSTPTLAPTSSPASLGSNVLPLSMSGGWNMFLVGGILGPGLYMLVDFFLTA